MLGRVAIRCRLARPSALRAALASISLSTSANSWARSLCSLPPKSDPDHGEDEAHTEGRRIQTPTYKQRGECRSQKQISDNEKADAAICVLP